MNYNYLPDKPDPFDWKLAAVIMGVCLAYVLVAWIDYSTC